MHATELAAGPDPNPGFVTRREYIAGSRVVDMMGRLHVDMFLQDKFLINGVDVKLRLVRSKPSFALMAAGPQRVQDNHRQRVLVRQEGHPQSGRADGSHHGSRADHGQVSVTTRRMQGVLHSHGSSVAHAREPVPQLPCRNVSYCAASTTTPTTARTPQTRFTPRTTP